MNATKPILCSFLAASTALSITVAQASDQLQAGNQLQAGAAPPPLANISAQTFKSSAAVTGTAPSEHNLGSGAVVEMGKTLTSAATSGLAPFNSMAGAHITLAPGPTAPVRLGLTAGAVNDGLGAPPFTPVYREGRVDLDTLLTLPCTVGTRWDLNLNAVIQATWGAGIGCAQVQLDVGDDGVIEASWGCMTPTQQQGLLGTATDNGGLRIRLRVVGEARSWTTSTPDHFLLNLTLDCTPAATADYGADFGVFDLESAARRIGTGNAALAAQPIDRERFAAVATTA